MQHRRYKLHFLLHTFTQILNFLLPPIFHVQSLKPMIQPRFGLLFGKAFELSEVDHLFTYLHLFIKTALFGEVADLSDMIGRKWLAIEQDVSRIWSRYLIDNPDQGCFSGTIWTKQTEDFSCGNSHGDIIQCTMFCVLFDNIVNFKHNCYLQKLRYKKTAELPVSRYENRWIIGKIGCFSKKSQVSCIDI